MATITVKLMDGRLGSIDSTEFNPATMKQVDLPQTDKSAQSAPQQQGGDDVVSNILNSIISPFVRTGQTIGGGAYELGRAGLALTQGKKAYEKGGAYAPENQANPFLSKEKLQEYNTDPRKALTSQVKDSINVASYGVPFGKGASLFSKVLAPGAAVGGMQALSEENVDPTSIAKGALLGATGAGVLHGGMKILGGASSLLGKISPAFETGAQKLESGTRQIRVKPSVYGASQEKAINETLTKYGVKGSPQAQYEMLQPTMNKIEGKIQKVIEENPSVNITKEEIKQSFADNLKSSLRSKDLTQNQATSEIDGYLKDLIKASGGKGKFIDISLERLRQLKRLVNDDYGAVHDIMERGGNLTPRQKVIAAAWDSLDSAVKNASPEMKKLLRDESNLYKSAPSLSAARSNPPTLRFMGTSIPAGATQKGKDVLTDVLKAGANKTNAISNIGENISSGTNNSALQNVLGQDGARLPQVINTNGNKPNQEETYDNGNNIQNSSLPDPSISQPKNYITGYSPEKIYQAYQQALMVGDKASVSQLRQMYEDEITYQKSQQTSTPKAVPAALKQRMDLSRAGLRAQHDALDEYNKDPNIVLKGTFSGGALSRKYDSAISRAVEGLLRARSGAAVPDSEVKKYIRDYAPRIGDTQKTALYKLQQLKLDLEDALENNDNVGPDYQQQAGSL